MREVCLAILNWAASLKHQAAVMKEIFWEQDVTLATETKHRPICQQYCRWDMKVPVQPMACTGPLYPQMSHWVKKLFVQAGVLYGDFHYWQKLYHHMWKIMIIVCESQSAADMSLALFGAMNGWQWVLFLKHELNRVLLVRNNHVYIKNKIIHGGLEKWNFSLRVQLDISLVHCTHSWDIESIAQREISACPCVILYITQKHKDRVMSLKSCNSIPRFRGPYPLALTFCGSPIFTVLIEVLYSAIKF